MASICVPRYIFIDGLNPNFQPGAPIVQHVAQVPLQAIIRPRLNSDPNALGPTLFRVANSLWNVIRRMTRQGVMKISYEIVPVV
jgi:hypothetical protein